MRPASRSNLGSSGGAPPGTGMRPGSGARKAPGTARLRTGVAPTGPGTQAAQGIALSASINVSDRPMTGHGVMGMKVQGQNQGRLVEDAAYYIGLLRKKISDVNSETIKLRTEVEQQSKDNSQYTQLERRYENLLKNKENLEGQLADYNLALDKVSECFASALSIAERVFTFFLSLIILSSVPLFRFALPQTLKMSIKWLCICQKKIVKLDKILIEFSCKGNNVNQKHHKLRSKLKKSINQYRSD
jgi:hypothetical protein